MYGRLLASSCDPSVCLSVTLWTVVRSITATAAEQLVAYLRDEELTLGGFTLLSFRLNVFCLLTQRMERSR